MTIPPTVTKSMLAPFLKMENRVPGLSFREWWFLDTNCLSELIKLVRQNQRKKVDNFISDAAILLTTTNLLELRMSSARLYDDLWDTFSGSLVCILPDVSNLLRAEVATYLEEDEASGNVMGIAHLSKEFIDLFLENPHLESYISESKKKFGEIFLSKVKPDVGGLQDEIDICVHIASVINSYAKKIFGKEIDPIACNVKNFPAFYSHYFAYYHRYMKNDKVMPQVNDFGDLLNTIVAPYCTRYYCEATFANVLKQGVQQTRLPDYYKIVKKVSKKVPLAAETIRNAKKLRNLNEMYALYAQVQIFKFAEMREQINSLERNI